MGEALAVGVELGGVVELVEGVDSAGGDEVMVGADDGEPVGLALPDGGVGVAEGEGVGPGVAAEAVGLVVSDGAGGVELPAGVGVELSTGEVSDGPRAGAAVDEGAPTPGGIVGVFSGLSAEEARGKEKKNKSPASNRAPGGLNKGTFTLSS